MAYFKLISQCVPGTVEEIFEDLPSMQPASKRVGLPQLSPKADALHKHSTIIV